MNPYLLLDHQEVKRCYDERLQEAAQERLARRVQAGQPGFVARSRASLGQALISLAQKVSAQPGARAATPAFQTK